MRPGELPTLAQIVAALSVTYKPAGVVIWLHANRNLLDDLPKLADMVARVDGCDPRDFQVIERGSDARQ